MPWEGNTLKGWKNEAGILAEYILLTRAVLALRWLINAGKRKTRGIPVSRPMARTYAALTIDPDTVCDQEQRPGNVERN